jgi:hypothetical protein
MKALAVRCLVPIVVASAGVGTLSAQPSPRVGSGTQAQWARELSSRFFGDEPGWQWVPAVQSGRVALVKSEKRILVGAWHEVDVGREIFAFSIDLRCGHRHGRATLARAPF